VNIVGGAVVAIEEAAGVGGSFRTLPRRGDESGDDISQEGNPQKLATYSCENLSAMSACTIQMDKKCHWNLHPCFHSHCQAHRHIHDISGRCQRRPLMTVMGLPFQNRQGRHCKAAAILGLPVNGSAQPKALGT